MLLAIPHFSKVRKEQRVEIVRIEDIRKVILRIMEDYTEIILVKNEPIGKIYVRREATINALDNLYRVMKMADRVSIVTIDENGDIKMLKDMLKEVLKGGKNEEV